MKKVIALFIAIAYIIPFSFSLTIVSEIMYNPLEGSEWIEMYTDEEINLSGYLLKDNYQTDEIICCSDNCTFIVEKGTYFVIGENNALEDFIDFCVDDKNIGNGLGNNGDTIIIYKDNEILVNFTYNNSITKGNSLSLINNTYIESSPTPKKQNEYIQPSSLPTIHKNIETGITNQEYYLFSLKNTYGTVNSTFFYNVSLTKNNTEVFFYENKEDVAFKLSKSIFKYLFIEPGEYYICGEMDSTNLCYTINITDSEKISCNISLWIESTKEIYFPGEKIEYYVRLSNLSYSYEIEYWIEDIFGKDIKTPYMTKNVNKKTYTPKFQELEKPLLLKAKLNYISCNNSAQNTSSSLLIAVQGKEGEVLINKMNSSIKIELPEKETSYGEKIYPKLKITKGDTSKYVVKIYLMKENKQSDLFSIYIYGKNKEIEFKIPLILTPSNFKEGEYVLVAEGLDILEKETIFIKEKTKISKKEEFDLIYYTEKITNESMFIVNIENTEDSIKIFEVWSYLYSGSKCYSGERTENKEKIILEPHTSKAAVLKNKLSEFPEKDIKAKIKVLEIGQNTEREITKNISFEKKLADEIPNETKEEINHNISLNQITGQTIYKSSSSKIKDYSSYFLIVIILVSIYALIKIQRTQ